MQWQLNVCMCGINENSGMKCVAYIKQQWHGMYECVGYNRHEICAWHATRLGGVWSAVAGEGEGGGG